MPAGLGVLKAMNADPYAGPWGGKRYENLGGYCSVVLESSTRNPNCVKKQSLCEQNTVAYGIPDYRSLPRCRDSPVDSISRDCACKPGQCEAGDKYVVY